MRAGSPRSRRSARPGPRRAAAVHADPRARRRCRPPKPSRQPPEAWPRRPTAHSASRLHSNGISQRGRRDAPARSDRFRRDTAGAWSPRSTALAQAAPAAARRSAGRALMRRCDLLAQALPAPPDRRGRRRGAATPAAGPADRRAGLTPSAPRGLDLGQPGHQPQQQGRARAVAEVARRSVGVQRQRRRRLRSAAAAGPAAGTRTALGHAPSAVVAARPEGAHRAARAASPRRHRPHWSSANTARAARRHAGRRPAPRRARVRDGGSKRAEATHRRLHHHARIIAMPSGPLKPA